MGIRFNNECLHLFVTYEIAEKLQEKNFESPYLAYFNKTRTKIPSLVLVNGGTPKEYFQSHIENFIPVPLYDQVINWLIKKHNIYLTVKVDQTLEPKYCYSISQYNESSEYEALWTNHVVNSDLYYKYNKALQDGILKALSII